MLDDGISKAKSGYFNTPQAIIDINKSQQKQIDTTTRIPSINYDHEFAQEYKKTQQKPAELSINDKFNLESAKEKYRTNKTLTAAESISVMRYSQNIADFTGTAPKSVAATLKNLTGVENNSESASANSAIKKANAFLIKPIETAVDPTKDFLNNAIEKQTAKDLSYLDTDEQEEYNRKKMAGELEARQYFDSKSDKINMKQGLEVADSYIKGNFGEKAISGLYAWIGTGLSDVGWSDSFQAINEIITGKKCRKEKRTRANTLMHTSQIILRRMVK